VYDQNIFVVSMSLPYRPEDLFELLANQRSQGIPPERIAGFFIDGTKKLEDGVFIRDILYLTKPQGQRSFSEFVQLLEEFQSEAILSQCHTLIVRGYSLVNVSLNYLLLNPKFHNRYRVRFIQLDNGVFEFIKNLPVDNKDPIL
jgi:hypothetical protein